MRFISPASTSQTVRATTLCRTNPAVGAGCTLLSVRLTVLPRA